MSGLARLAAAALGAAAAAACAKPSGFMDPIPSSQALRDVGQARRDLERAMAHHDRLALEALLTDDFVHVSGRGEFQDRAAFIQASQVRDTGEAQAGATDQVVTRLYGNTAVVVGRHWPRRQGAGATGEPVRFSAVFVRSNGHWRVASLQLTRVAAGAPTSR